ncbi:glucose-methanol-choline oxidoreductase [Stenotrophomonas maltophilia]|uniref:GMC family oxidoreductase n=1 Tax=Stenotrophomonas maltophilia TaxID=40324 RepID=UPI0010764010|nr:GMC oxidoreductase [Stenotrophomonas maltophilia]TFZ45020.1 glucose-methanol-choline oxidoreductase [Stenotrophomonas maltophilia]
MNETSQPQQLPSSAIPGARTRYDYVIVGGGSAGCVLASRLSEDAGKQVLLIEAGRAFDPDAYPELIYNSNIVAANADPRYEWGYFADPVKQPGPVYTPRGKVLGGSSAINAAVAVRALPIDFERWSAKGLQGWDYNDVLPYYRKMERTVHGADALHGRDGPLPIHQMSLDYITPMQRAMVEASWRLGYGEVRDFNDPHANNGAGPIPMNIVNGVRVNAAMAYLPDSVRARANLTIVDQVLVDRVMFDGQQARAVRLADGTQLAGDEIVLCAGAYGSANILQRSGIGPRLDLEALGIGVLKDAPVGTGLLDHVFYWLNYAGPPELTGIDLEHPVVAAMLWTHSSLASSDRDLDIGISPSHLLDPGLSSTGVAFSLGLELMDARSRGVVKLTSRDPAEKPYIRFNHLTDPLDMQRMIEAFRIARRLAATDPLKSLIVNEIYPGPSVGDSDDEIADSLARGAMTLQHPSGTVRMGTADDPDAVVDGSGRVHGIRGLRVVDASIFPVIPSINLNPTVIMVAEKIADEMRRG